MADEQDISDVVEGMQDALAQEPGTKKAIDTLHPKDEERKDRLTKLEKHEIKSIAVIEFHLKALNNKDLTKTFLLEGLTDKIKALKVSEGGGGRQEVTSIFKPEIQGELFGGMQQGQHRPFFRRMFGG